MAIANNRRIVSMNDTDLTLADPAEDVRGRTVVDASGGDIGDVEDLMLDEEESKVRFLQAGAGGFLGIGERKFLIPVDAISRIDDDHVYVDRSREHIIAGPDYDPALVRDDAVDLWENAYTWYGFAPFWAPEYIPPTYPFHDTAATGRLGGQATDDQTGAGGPAPDAGKRNQRDANA